MDLRSKGVHSGRLGVSDMSRIFQQHTHTHQHTHTRARTGTCTYKHKLLHQYGRMCVLNMSACAYSFVNEQVHMCYDTAYLCMQVCTLAECFCSCPYDAKVYKHKIHMHVPVLDQI